MSRIIAAMRATLASTRRSDEISLVMNAKPGRSRSRNSGVTRMPSRPQTTRSPARTSRSLRHSARPVSTTIDGVHALPLDLEPAPPTRTCGPLVGGGVEVVRHAAVLLGHAHGGILLVDGVAAERHELLEEILQRRALGA